MHRIKKVVFIGSGNVATHLAQAAINAGLEILGIYSRKSETASVLAKKHHAKWGNLSEIDINIADIIIISVPDNAMNDVLMHIPQTNILTVHTSGSMDINILTGARVGVFYPLQTFSKSKKLNYRNIPIMLEAKQEEDVLLLEQLAQSISDKVYQINSTQRKKIHIAAIFSSNFTNYLFHIAADLLSKEDIPFGVIQPLIEETVEKLKELHPYHAQTGPAVRNDQETISRHLQELIEIPEYHEIYKIMSEHIIKSRKK